MSEKDKKYAFSSAGEMFRSVFGEDAVKTVEVPSETDHDKAVCGFIRTFEAACMASTGSLMLFK